MYRICSKLKGMNRFLLRTSKVLSPSSSITMQICPSCSNQSSILTQALATAGGMTVLAQEEEEPGKILGSAEGSTHNLLSSSRPLISSSTAISDLATSRKHGMFRTIFTATRSSLWKTAALRDQHVLPPSPMCGARRFVSGTCLYRGTPPLFQTLPSPGWTPPRLWGTNPKRWISTS